MEDTEILVNSFIVEEPEFDYMEDIDEDLYILGIPIKTSIGYCHFLKVKDYPRLIEDLNVVSLTKLHYIHAFKKNNEDAEAIEQIEQLDLLSIVANLPDVFDAYQRVFNHFFKGEEVINNIQTVEEFEYCRNLILKFSCIQEEIVNPHPEIQESIERGRRVKASKSGGLKFSTIVTSVSAIGKKNYEAIREMTLFQLYMDFYRIAQEINYHTSTLFATVAEKVDIDDWSKTINMFEEEKHGLTRSEFSKIAGVLDD